MENKVIAKEYVDKNYVEKSILKKAMREGMYRSRKSYYRKNNNKIEEATDDMSRL